MGVFMTVSIYKTELNRRLVGFGVSLIRDLYVKLIYSFFLNLGSSSNLLLSISMYYAITGTWIMRYHLMGTCRLHI